MRISGEGRLGRAATALLPAVVLAIGMAGAMAPQAAQAQFFDWGGGWGNGGWGNGSDWNGIRPAQIYRSLADRGFRVISPLSRDGAVFIADVIDRRGRRERVVVSAADGRIVQRFVLSDERRMQRNAGLPGDDLEQQMDQADRFGGAPPLPPAPIPNAGLYGRQDPNPDGDTLVEPVQPRPAPRVRPIKPRLVERTPDVLPTEPDSAPSQPLRLKIRPTQPLRLPGAPDTASDRPNVPATVTTASRPADAVVSPSAPSPAIAPPPPSPSSAASVSPPSSKMRDPLAIPRNEPKPVEPPKASASATIDPPRKVVPGTVTGAPSSDPIAPKPAKGGDVPVAPLD